MDDALEFRLSEIERRIAVLCGQMQQLAVKKEAVPTGVRLHLDEIASQYRDGKTLQEIGAKYGCSREYIRQLLAKRGITKVDGGKHVRVKNKRESLNKAALLRRDQRAIRTFGCTHDIVLGLNEGLLPSDVSSLAMAFVRKRINARRLNPSVEWGLSFPDFVSLWEESGLPRGQGSKCGAVVRRDVTKGWVAGNVAIVPLGQHVADVRRAEAAARNR